MVNKGGFFVEHVYNYISIYILPYKWRHYLITYFNLIYVLVKQFQINFLF